MLLNFKNAVMCVCPDAPPSQLFTKLKLVPPGRYDRGCAANKYPFLLISTSFLTENTVFPLA